ncbi:hypothetical protein CLIB1423_01S02234 [[Candida] railenensis]|uniref:DUF4259 domain-containing protein n=1 Tax=[Candida] railenensis TaxID=45579 RepID=A0A9P0QK30_9ASCO|nr:hypothetical protein CLIB1423_01S02234 [[Candida] railenensis]
MGAWGHNLLDNDTACDTFARLTDPKAEAPVAEIFHTIEEYSNPDTFSGYIEDDEVNEILVCILLVVGFTDKTLIEVRTDKSINKYFTDKISKFLKQHQKTFDDSVKVDYYEKSEKLFERILDVEKSETYELWNEAGGEDCKSWVEMVTKIREDLVKVTPQSI